MINAIITVECDYPNCVNVLDGQYDWFSEMEDAKAAARFRNWTFMNNDTVFCEEHSPRIR